MSIPEDSLDDLTTGFSELPPLESREDSYVTASEAEQEATSQWWDFDFDEDEMSPEASPEPSAQPSPEPEGILYNISFDTIYIYSD